MRKILIVTPEIFPQIKVGGLGQFIAGISESLKKKGFNIKVISPSGRQPIYGPVRSKQTQRRYRVLAKEALSYCQEEGFIPEIIWVHDWCGIWALQEFAKNQISDEVTTAWTLHSPIGKGYAYEYEYDGPEEEKEPIDWGDDFFDFTQLINGSLSLAKKVSTVSESYARELGKNELFSSCKVRGISNGIDRNFWDAEKDELIRFRLLNSNWLYFKKKNKEFLQEIFSLPKIDVPIFAFVSRIRRQKGIDLLTTVLPEFIGKNKVQFILVGKGTKSYHHFFNQLKIAFPTKVGIKLEADFVLPHQIFAGADFLILPSLVEPGGIVVQEAANYGALPIVRLTGGLRDQVEDGKSGLGFHHFRPLALEEKMHEAIQLYERSAYWELTKKAREEVKDWRDITEEYLKWFDEPH